MGRLVRQHLRQDHERLEWLLAAVQVAFEGDETESVASTWARFATELIAHIEAEERFLIPTLFRTNQREARALLEEHRYIRARLTELGAEVDLHIVRAHAVRAFIEELRAHARHEDSALYRWADECLEDADRQPLADFLAGSTSPVSPATSIASGAVSRSC